MTYKSGPGFAISVKLKIKNHPKILANLVSAISELGGDIRNMNFIKAEKNKTIREITINIQNEEHQRIIIEALKNFEGVKILEIIDKTFHIHQGGKIGIYNKFPIKDSEELSRAYTPGVARVCMDIFKNRDHVYSLTIKSNMVAVITDGSAVLGLGDIGPEAAMPVMEGKCMLFKEFGEVDAFPIAIKTKDVNEFVSIVKNISVPFGGINLEDISAPRCFEIEKRLKEELDIPVFHDDQHGTAIVVLAALINVGRLLKKDIKKFKIVISGAGAAGIAIANMLCDYGIRNILVCDSKGILYEGRSNMNPYKEEIAKKTNLQKIKGFLSDALEGADVFIGVSAPDILKPEDIKKMSEVRVVFALSNPDPEISPELALPLVKIMATGRSDYPNQINNVLAFPGIFKGLLEVKAKGVHKDMFFAAAHAIADIVKEEDLREDYIIPSIFNKEVAKRVAEVVAQKARELGLARC
ncbi:NAD-dependent malic enzyme [Thermodesulfobacterium hydrogeniphilum]|uniref:NAD-dependent malic enzyme n=1 Tax=Thermodesulfobacterium hydrogeniphilum TaxID=161156 RepID=UPI00056DAD96|nr:NAD-dependent malic enzyme [Thermodesulfobacterium hydrogeniphilum]